MAHMVQCVKLGRQAEGLDEPPFDTPLGQKIYDNVSKLAWEQWEGHMKMLLNEYRLQPWKKEHQEFIVQQMDQYFFGEGSQLPEEFVPEDIIFAPDLTAFPAPDFTSARAMFDTGQAHARQVLASRHEKED